MLIFGHDFPFGINGGSGGDSSVHGQPFLPLGGDGSLFNKLILRSDSTPNFQLAGRILG
ncbi:MAG: hypothetical protein WCP96_10500 [Methylococcaceae bacterium]